MRAPRHRRPSAALVGAAAVGALVAALLPQSASAAPVPDTGGDVGVAVSAGGADQVLMFAADGMRQDLIERYADEKVVPGFRDLLRRGAKATGSGMLTQAPPNTGAGWYTMATGAWPAVHGSTNNTFHRVSQPFTSSTSGLSAGVLQAETIAQAAERGGQKVVQMEWAGGRYGTIDGPTVDYRTFLSGRGVTTNYVSPTDRPALITSFGLQYDQVTVAPATGWTGAPTSYSPALETRMRVLDFGVDKYGLEAYVYDSTDDGTTNYDRVLFATTKDAATQVADVAEGEFADVKVTIQSTSPDLNGRTGGTEVARGAGKNARVVDLTPFLDGTYVAPVPSVGGLREDHVHMLYPGKWHTMIAPNTAGKSWFALWHVIAELRRGNTVAYAHFEEASPGGTIARLRILGCSIELIQNRFKWLDCTTAWKGGEFAAALPEDVTLVILDGIVAACSQHGWPVDKPEGEGEYRERFVKPATARRAAVLGLGHPVKNQDRQWERHGLGTTAWLDNIDGVGFRLVPSKNPIRGKQSGSSALYSVKDRASQVEEHGRSEERHAGWVYLGQFVVDSSPGQIPTAAWVSAPKAEEETAQGSSALDAIDQLAEAIVLRLAGGTGRFDSQAKLIDDLRAHKAAFNDRDVTPALIRLADDERIEWPEVKPGRARPGWLQVEDRPGNLIDLDVGTSVTPVPPKGEAQSTEVQEGDRQPPCTEPVQRFTEVTEVPDHHQLAMRVNCGEWSPHWVPHGEVVAQQEALRAQSKAKKSASSGEERTFVMSSAAPLDRRLLDAGLLARVSLFAEVFADHCPEGEKPAECSRCGHNYSVSEPWCPTVVLVTPKLLKRRNEEPGAIPERVSKTLKGVLEDIRKAKPPRQRRAPEQTDALFDFVPYLQEKVKAGSSSTRHTA